MTTELNHPFADVALTGPLSTRSARTLREVYENIPRLSVAPDSGIDVIHSETGLVIRAGNGESHGAGLEEIPPIRHWTQMLESSFLNRHFINRYNRYRRIWGSDGVAVTASDRDIVIESADGGGGVFLPFLEPVGGADSSRGWLATSVHMPLFNLARLWSFMRAVEPVELSKARRNYILSGGVPVEPDVGCIFHEDWDGDSQFLGKTSLLQWDVLTNNIDIIGTGGFDPLPGNGNYLDLSGTLGLFDFAGAIIRTTANVTLKNQNYEFYYKVAGDNRAGGGNSVMTVNFHTVSETHVLDTADPATVFSHTVSGPYSGKITFECTQVNQADQSKGPMILEVDVCVV